MQTHANVVSIENPVIKSEILAHYKESPMTGTSFIWRPEWVNNMPVEGYIFEYASLEDDGYSWNIYSHPLYGWYINANGNLYRIVKL